MANSSLLHTGLLLDLGDEGPESPPGRCQSPPAEIRLLEAADAAASSFSLHNPGTKRFGFVSKAASAGWAADKAGCVADSVVGVGVVGVVVLVSRKGRNSSVRWLRLHFALLLENQTFNLIFIIPYN